MRAVSRSEKSTEGRWERQGDGLGRKAAPLLADGVVRAPDPGLEAADTAQQLGQTG